MENGVVAHMSKWISEMKSDMWCCVSIFDPNDNYYNIKSCSINGYSQIIIFYSIIMLYTLPKKKNKIKINKINKTRKNELKI